MFDEPGVRRLLQKLCAECSQKEFADQHGISPQYVHDVITGRRMPGASILNALGLRKRVIYEFKLKDAIANTKRERDLMKKTRAFPGVKVRVE